MSLTARARTDNVTHIQDNTPQAAREINTSHIHNMKRAMRTDERHTHNSYRAIYPILEMRRSTQSNARGAWTSGEQIDLTPGEQSTDEELEIDRTDMDDLTQFLHFPRPLHTTLENAPRDISPGHLSDGGRTRGNVPQSHTNIRHPHHPLPSTNTPTQTYTPEPPLANHPSTPRTFRIHQHRKATENTLTILSWNIAGLNRASNPLWDVSDLEMITKLHTPHIS